MRTEITSSTFNSIFLHLRHKSKYDTSCTVQYYIQHGVDRYSPSFRIHDSLKKKKSEVRGTIIELVTKEESSDKHNDYDSRLHVLYIEQKPTLCSDMSFSMNAVAAASRSSADVVMVVGLLLFSFLLLSLLLLLN